MKTQSLTVVIGVALVAATAFSQEPKTGIQETGIDEIANVKPAVSKGAVTAEKFLRKLDAGGFKVKGRTEVLGKLVGAGLCIQASAGGATFTVCEYSDVGAAAKGREKRKTIFGEGGKEHTNGALTLTIAASTDENVKKSQTGIAKVFGLLGKPAGQKDEKDGKDERDRKDK